MGEHLQNAPLVEALLELKWALHQDSEAAPLRDLAYPIIIGLLYGQVKNDYPFIERLPQSLFPAEMIVLRPKNWTVIKGSLRNIRLCNNVLSLPLGLKLSWG